jgi:hypothetical protein
MSERMNGIVVHPRRLSPPWLDGSATVYELTRHTARKLARDAKLHHLPRVGYYALMLPASGWRELHRNPPGSDKPFYVF